MLPSSISNFKLFLIKVLLPFLAIALPTGWGIDTIYTQKVVFGSPFMEPYKFRRILLETHAQEIPILGGSIAMNNFVCDSIHPNAFNYGVTGIGTKIINLQLEQELKKVKNTPIIITIPLDVRDADIADERYYLPLVNKEFVQDSILKEKCMFRYHIPFIRYFGSYDYYLKNYFNSRNNLTNFYDKKGGLQYNQYISPQEFAVYVAQRAKVKTYWQKTPEVERFIQNLLKSKRKIFLVFSPLHPSYIHSIENKEEVYRDFAVLKSNPNVTVLDFSSNLQDDQYFFNTSHLNGKGARYFSQILGDSLANYGFKK